MIDRIETEALLALMAAMREGPWLAHGTDVFAGKDCVAMCETDNAPPAQMEANARGMALVQSLAAEVLEHREAAERAEASNVQKLHNAPTGDLISREAVRGLREPKATSSYIVQGWNAAIEAACVLPSQQAQGVGETDIAEVVRGVWGRCDYLEDEASQKLSNRGGLSDHEQGFWTAQRVTAKSIRRSTEMPPLHRKGKRDAEPRN